MDLQLGDFNVAQGLVQQKAINDDELFTSILEPVKVEKEKNEDASSFAKDLASMSQMEEQSSPEYIAKQIEMEKAQ